jgi:outer membrane protein OmpA-like peptidoglycan-associated protein
VDQRKEQQNLIQERIRDGYRKIESIFDPHEAAVDLREGQIVIRLRAMEFAVGESEILPQNAALLEKVGRALSHFEDTDVIIEGHTDNVGSDAVNESLSERRAESVRHYLVMKENLPYDRMIAIGYGSTRPLTSNATEAGRAVNRRIDLIVIPHMPDR